MGSAYLALRMSNHGVGSDDTIVVATALERLVEI